MPEDNFFILSYKWWEQWKFYVNCVKNDKIYDED